MKRSLFVSILVLIASSHGPGQDRFNQQLLDAFQFRSLGPYRCGSWISDFAVPDSPADAHLYTFYVASRNGGVWRTTNNGTTFEPIFDKADRLSIGCIAIAPSNSNIVWVGTGEAFNARSSHSGDGVYKSTDAGKTWKKMGLEDSQHIARIVIDPGNPDIVFLASVGHLFSRNDERGVFKTTDGGTTWKKVLFVNNKVGAIDLVMDKSEPSVLYAATYDKERLPWHFEEGGPGSGIYKTTDGGTSWRRLSGGLPSGTIGRIGIDLYQKNPKILYALFENLNKRPPTEEEARADRRRGSQPQERTMGGQVYRTEDGGTTWKMMNTGTEGIGTKAAYSFNQIRVDQNDPKKIYVTGITLASSTDAGKTWSDADWPPRTLFKNAFGDVRTLWIDPQNSNRMLFGSDGGVYLTYDGGKTCDHLYNIPLGEYYAIALDNQDPYNIYGGLQDHDSWKGPSNGQTGDVTLSDWTTVGTSDGMYNQVDPVDARYVYTTHELGGHQRVDQKLGTITGIQPQRDKSKEPYRWNWTAPLLISPHDHSAIYTGAQVVLHSTDRGDHWEEISPDLTTNDKAKIAVTGSAISFCTITTIAESPVQAGLLWVGTDDGKVHLTTDGGKTWLDRTERLAAAGGPAGIWVSRVFASAVAPGTAYVTKTGMRMDIFRPFVFKTTDYGTSWTSISSNLPSLCVNVIVQDRKNPNLLIVGTDQGVYASMNDGAAWCRFGSAIPSVKVTDLLVHPRQNDLVVATYGRGLFIANIAPLQQLTAQILDTETHLFSLQPRSPFITSGWGNYRLLGDRNLVTPNESNAISIDFYLRQAPADSVRVSVSDDSGHVLRKLVERGKAGINRIEWDMRGRTQQESSEQRGGFRFRLPLVPPGRYRIALTVDGKHIEGDAVVQSSRGWSLGPFPVEEPPR